eukprot:GEMP01004272.1.p1 GENE.GEMP01004272.1~~GEMP01004272.1.p1  ORF type:complete len:518 (+),score=118.22 GEMP01004272.1:343-1896(+)
MGGNNFSAPVGHNPDLGYVGISLRGHDKVRLLHAPDDVINMTKRIITDIYDAVHINLVTDVAVSDKHGCVQVKVSRRVSAALNAEGRDMRGELFMIRLFEDMHMLGYDSVASSYLARQVDLGTLLFVKTAMKDERACEGTPHVVGVATDLNEKLILLRATPAFTLAVKAAFALLRPRWIQEEVIEDVCGDKVTKFKLNPRPRVEDSSHDGKDEECRRMLLTLIGELAKLHYRLLPGVNIKGGTTDALFFVHDPTYERTRTDFCMISLIRSDCLRVINCNTMAPVVRNAILRNGNTIQRDEDKDSGGWEFQLEGMPWSSTDDEAVQARRLIAVIAQTMLTNGWALTGALDVHRTVPDKSVLLFSSVSPCPFAEVACIALSDSNRMHLLDFPPVFATQLCNAIALNYLPGIRKLSQSVDTVEINLNGRPWGPNASYNLQATSALMGALKVANVRGWRLVASADVSARYGFSCRNGRHCCFPLDAHTWYLVKCGEKQNEVERVGEAVNLNELVEKNNLET